jgi:hypothetical protein
VSPTEIAGYQKPSCSLRSQMNRSNNVHATGSGAGPGIISRWRINRLSPVVCSATSSAVQMPCPLDSGRIEGMPAAAAVEKVDPAVSL